MEFCAERDSPNKGGPALVPSRLCFCRFKGSPAMVKQRKSTPMETQPGHGATHVATPMAHASSKHGQAPGKSTSLLSRSQTDAARKRSLKKQRSMLNG
jgi:hypothetical protein